MQKISLIGFIIYIIFLVFSRFYNLENTARFGEDESGFLVRAHQIYLEKKITLVGQINEQGTKVFSSLTVYLLLPAAILGKFDPVSMFYGAAFWGVITGIIMLFLGKKINSKLLIFSGILILVWFPLLQMGRWAWNPNFIPLWISLGIIFYLQKKSFYIFLAGVFFGLSVHQHYYAIFAISIFTLIVFVEAILKRQFKNAFLIVFGIFLSLLPFLIFDLRHMPGIFLLGASNQISNSQPSQFFTNFINYGFAVMKDYGQSVSLAIVLTFSIAMLFIFDLKKRSRALFYLLPCFFQVILIAITAPYFPHYFFPIIPFFFVWLIYPRKGMASAFSFLVITIIILGGMLSFKTQLTVSPVVPNLATVKKISKILKNQIQSSELKNINLAVLSSPDHNTQGRKYRDLLLVMDNNIKFKIREEIPTSENLFVISTAQEKELRNDLAYELDNFRNGILINKQSVDNSNWVVYSFTRNVKNK